MLNYAPLPHYPSTLRNRDAIIKVLGLYLPACNHILETATGSGEHITYFGAKFPNIKWHPSDKSVELFWAIKKRIASSNNIFPPVELDLIKCDKFKMNYKCDGILSINMVHIAPWDASVGLFKLAKKNLRLGGFIFFYGPFTICGKHTSESNKRFDESLKKRSNSWGVRGIEDLEKLGKSYGFFLNKLHEMPTNNKVLIFKKVRIPK